jgi:hypothetical protein
MTMRGQKSIRRVRWATPTTWRRAGRGAGGTLQALANLATVSIWVSTIAAAHLNALASHVG